jgi:hypothetical protein
MTVNGAPSPPIWRPLRSFREAPCAAPSGVICSVVHFLLAEPAVPYGTCEDDDASHQQGPDSTTQYRAEDHVSHHVADPVCLWPEVAHALLAQRQADDAGKE